MQRVTVSYFIVSFLGVIMPGGALACSVAELRAPGAPALDRTGDAMHVQCVARVRGRRSGICTRDARSLESHTPPRCSHSHSHVLIPRIHVSTVAEKRQTFCLALGLSSERNRLGRIAIGCGHSCHGHYCRACDGAQDKIVPGRLPWANIWCGRTQKVRSQRPTSEVRRF